MAITKYVSVIRNTENIGDSLFKLNNNFYNLQVELCNLKAKVSNMYDIRTFFYYGPNAATDSTSGQQDEVTSRPSDRVIEDFVNGETQLNLTRISKANDQVYVIYQKTGYYKPEATRLTPGEKTVNIISASVRVNWVAESPDYWTVISPMFVIWKLTCNGSKYLVDPGFPKYSQSQTSSSVNWNDPTTWREY